MRITALIFITFILTGCPDEVPNERVEYDIAIPEENKEKAAEYVVKICEASNPKSDEEPEDMIWQAQKTAEKMYGKKTIGIYVWRNGSGSPGEFIPYWSLSKRQKKMCDDYLDGVKVNDD